MATFHDPEVKLSSASNPKAVLSSEPDVILELGSDMINTFSLLSSLYTGVMVPVTDSKTKVPVEVEETVNTCPTAPRVTGKTY